MLRLVCASHASRDPAEFIQRLPKTHLYQATRDHFTSLPWLEIDLTSCEDAR